MLNILDILAKIGSVSGLLSFIAFVYFCCYVQTRRLQGVVAQKMSSSIDENEIYLEMSILNSSFRPFSTLRVEIRRKKCGHFDKKIVLNPVNGGYVRQNEVKEFRADYLALCQSFEFCKTLDKNNVEIFFIFADGKSKKIPYEKFPVYLKDGNKMVKCDSKEMLVNHLKWLSKYANKKNESNAKAFISSCCKTENKS